MDPANSAGSGRTDLVGLVGRWWEQPELQGLNRLPARTVSSNTGSTVSPDGSSRLSLDGEWTFALAPDPEANAGPSTMITVPGCWTMADLGPAGSDHPHYTNVVMPFDGDPPSTPAHNPTGIYQRTFTVPDHWRQGARRVILHVGGAESAAAVWCNDRFVGLMTDSRLPTEFDLTSALSDATTTPTTTTSTAAGDAATLTILVPRWTSHTWIEDQDHWHHGGLHRSIFLRTVDPSAHLADLVITTDWDPTTGTGRADIEARVAGAYQGCSVTVDIAGIGTTTEPVAVFDTSSHVAQMEHTYTYPGPVAAVSLTSESVRAWSHEDPHLYAATITLTDPDGNTLATESHQVGFNRVEVVGAELLLNGVAVPISGVNRHDHHPDTGKTLTPAELRADVRQIKAAGLNAIRTAHYPPDPALLDACDEIGLWVVCEANLESHARWTEVSHDPRYQAAFVERTQRMVSTHRNHPSIMGWSLGNESGLGPAHDAAAAWVRHADPSRFVQYEGGVRNRWLADPAEANRAVDTDIICPMYPSVDEIVRWATHSKVDAPMIMCEYSHAMGNSNGDLDQYWSAIESHHGLQGGFIWDWKDQGLRLGHDTDDLGYGGHFGDKPNDGDFCCNGLVGAEGDPHPAIEELRYLTRPVVTDYQATPTPTLIITNRRSFTTIDDLTATVEITVDGIVVQSTPLTITGLAPGDRAETSTGITDGLITDQPAGSEVHITVRWADPTGQVVAWDQHALTASQRTSSGVGSTVTPGELSELLDRWGIGVPQLSVWRAPTDNDGVKVGPRANQIGALARWLELGIDRIRQVDEGRWQTPSGHEITHTRTVTVTLTPPETPAATTIWFTEEIEVPSELGDLPRVGMAFTVPAAATALEWFGPGPWETYPDRRHAPAAVHSSTVADQYVPYAVPQHHGTHINTRWFTLTSPDARLTFHTNGLAFDVSHYSTRTLTEATVPGDLESDPDHIHVHIDADLRGVGTAACGPDTSYRLEPQAYRFMWGCTLENP